MSTENQKNSRPSPADLETDFSLEDTVAQKLRAAPAKGATSAGGYNPYETVAPKAAGDSPRKPTDLRKLSEWIRLQREVEALKTDKPEEP